MALEIIEWYSMKFQNLLLYCDTSQLQFQDIPVSVKGALKLQNLLEGVNI